MQNRAFPRLWSVNCLTHKWLISYTIGPLHQDASGVVSTTGSVRANDCYGSAAHLSAAVPLELRIVLSGKVKALLGDY